MDQDAPTGCTLMNYWRQLKHRVSSYRERVEVLQLSKSICKYFRSVWNTMLLSLFVNPRPVMLCYMSDGWSAFTWTVFRECVDGNVVESWNKERIEFLLQRGILRIPRTCGGSSAAIFIHAPRPLLHGKAAWPIFTALTEFHSPLRESTKGACVFSVFLTGSICHALSV